VRVLLQRVRRASVAVEGEIVGRCGPGLLLLVGISNADDRTDPDYCANKILNLRVFPDDEGKMNRSARDVGAEILAVSQFTLYGDTRKGRRPGFTDAAPPERAEAMFAQFVSALRESGLQVETGRFGAHMEVELVNDGPITLLVESG